MPARRRKRADLISDRDFVLINGQNNPFPTRDSPGGNDENQLTEMLIGMEYDEEAPFDSEEEEDEDEDEDESNA